MIHRCAIYIMYMLLYVHFVCVLHINRAVVIGHRAAVVVLCWSCVSLAIVVVDVSTVFMSLL